ncbi:MULTISPECIES: ABC transporter ATP-binding protein [Brevibacillus]|jgi:oligopeptide/dipeptide ABC transporter ATP-binding protein|uniref:ABC transporter ATP-binding protein n=2 Tax=Brevibacillus TaxID=55080 RepID=UPI000469001C|nr:dipeptide ABC transporter ATP-binding protein [Brevibacillus borstelensis]MBE5395336.1 dipeptide ABC transporter ATP-binding protein [Brevibacillus borstelensis]MCM3468746.1 dipeptide ABC transporter ATP-binding protein [Brevibacillus borstelensis]MED1745618.1 dipeptide ABC transporter ATP-binding protein [Brevibacillus borstelensis]MED1873590.1 dipeptide ABC transporter ATP-binding protein [Brevibacillus borstelensis]MED1883498.1 dipeptide ABC transporter ATP-binding protein [Brevibacillus
MDQTKEPLLVVKGLKKHFPFKKGMFSKETGYVRAVDGVDFTVYRGETLGIVGESGCGKSTTGQMILQLLEPTEGEIWFEGKNLSTLGKAEVRTLRQHLQMIFQDPYSSLNPRMRVEEIVAEPLRVHGTHKGSELKEKVVELLRLVGLDAHHMSRHPHEFSGGQRQRIGIARALALNPSLIVCDEPVSALDVSIQSQVLNLLKKLQKELKLTYIFIAHGLPAVKHISDRIAVMYLGKIVELAERDELFANPRHPYTEALLSAVPIPDPTQRKERIVLQGDLPNPANPPSGCHFHTRCPYVQDVCRQTAPTLTEGAAGHFVSCHFPLAQSQEGVMG